ncbi:hypothetical protein GGI20_005924, partial [Coemansia sp. BCRC 34301]
DFGVAASTQQKQDVVEEATSSEAPAMASTLADDDFVLVSAGDVTGSPTAECQVVPDIVELDANTRPGAIGADGGESAAMARTLSVPLESINNNAQNATEPDPEADLAEDAGVAEVPTAAAEDSQPPAETDTMAADEPGLSAAHSDTGFIVIKERETTAAAAAAVSDLHNIDTIRSLDEVDSAMHNPSESGNASPPEATVTTPSYVMHYPESLFGDANSITPGLITMEDLHTAQKASAVVGVSAINATSVGRKSRDSGHHHHLLGDSEASVGQRMKRFIAGKRSDLPPGRSPSEMEPASPTKGGVTGLFSQYRSSRTSVDTKRTGASALESVAASESDLTETRGTRSATVHGTFEDELAKHGHTIPGSFPVERTGSQPSDGEGANPADAERDGEGNTSESEGGKD